MRLVRDLGPQETRAFRRARWFPVAMGTMLIATLAYVAAAAPQLRPSPPLHTDESAAQNERALEGYVGSNVCAQCHRGIFNSYSQTDMGRSVTEVDAAFLRKFPVSATIVSERLNRHFEVYARDDKLYQSEYAVGPDGSEIFRDTRQIQYIIGAGANGLGGIVQRGDYLFEAPLAYFARINGWDLSPGYESLDNGFSRPILPGCVVCHSGRPQPAVDGNGKFGQPPFYELAIGCENCHGPGKLHVEAHEGDSTASDTIVNPAKLTPWLADNICMECHQTGDARVLHPGKNYGDIRPGEPLDTTFSIFIVPFDRSAPPQDDMLEHYLSMRLSKCYRSSSGRMSCITCHDAHVQPTKQDAPEYFETICLTCHTLASCTARPEIRRATTPPDNCIACHMPEREVLRISHSALTNHRIVKTYDEPFPDAAYQMTTPALPDLVDLSAAPGSDAAPPPLKLLDVYGQVLLTHPEYRAKYWALAKQLEATESNNIGVLEALADSSMRQGDDEGDAAAIHDLARALALGSKIAADYEKLASLLIATGQRPESVNVLRQGIALIPDDEQMYRMLSSTYLYLGEKQDACQLLGNAIHIFPQDEPLRSLLNQCDR
jgi:hypothetical protein